MSTSSASSSEATRPPVQLPTLNFEVSPVPKNPLGEGRWIKTAACLIIGDEILNGKTHDKNSNYFAKFCFEQGVELKRIEVIADDENEIAEASRRMVETYDFVITSGGIGPTHDDITYESLARSFSMPLSHHQDTLRRMEESAKLRYNFQTQTAEQRTARERMAYFPSGEGAEVIHVHKDLWVPVVRLKGKLCILPGIPSLFQRLLDNLIPYLPLPPPSERPFRHLVFTRTPESSIAPYLTSLHKRLGPEGIRVGSYPSFERGVTVSLIGRDEERVREIGQEVVKELQGEVIEAKRVGEGGPESAKSVNIDQKK